MVFAENYFLAQKTYQISDIFSEDLDVIYFLVVPIVINNIDELKGIIVVRIIITVANINFYHAFLFYCLFTFNSL